MAGDLTKPLETLQYLFIERYPYFYKPPMEMQVYKHTIRMVKVHRIFGLEKVWRSIPLIGGAIAVIALFRATILVSRQCALQSCPLLPLKVTGWSWLALMVACGTCAYYLIFVKFNLETMQSLEELGNIRGKLVNAQESKKGAKSGSKPNLVGKILIFWIWIAYLVTPIAIFFIVLFDIDPSAQLVEKFWQHFPFMKVLAIKIALGSKVLFQLGVFGGRYLVILGIVYEIERLGLWFGALGLYATNGLIDILLRRQILLLTPTSDNARSNWNHIQWYNGVRILFQIPEILLSNVASLGAIASGSSIVECAYILIRLHSSLPFKMSTVAFPLFLTAIICTKLGGDMAVNVFEQSRLFLIVIHKRNIKGNPGYKVVDRSLKAMRPISLPIGISGARLAEVTKHCTAVIFHLIFDLTIHVLMTF
ncbi:uncharacterized protein LOC110843618 [Folsomia candida]|uniref:uncharacterized protein LOC110843618 n=1 Tax=Folsomia candida TaxID=158441 RepID=UPI0016054AB3|nr:uncharacterized protein LOC110843618 [Folsomia candida]